MTFVCFFMTCDVVGMPCCLECIYKKTCMSYLSSPEDAHRKSHKRGCISFIHTMNKEGDDEDG